MKKNLVFLSFGLCASTVVLSQSNTFPPSGNVGIGTLSPSYDLHVAGDVLGAGYYGLGSRLGDYNSSSLDDSYLGVKGFSTGNGASWDLLYLESGTNGKRVFSADNNNSITVGELLSSGDVGRINLGTTDYFIKSTFGNGIEIDANGDGLVVTELQAGKLSGTGTEAILYLGDGNHFIKSGFSQGVTIGTFGASGGITLKENTGNVGVGVVNPSQKLHVAGGARITNLGGSGTQMVVTDNSGVLSKQPIPSGDNLGNHSATQTLDMNDRFIANTLRIDFSDNTTQTSASPWKYRSGFGSNFWTDERVKLGGSGTLSDANFTFEVASGDDSKFGGDVEVVGVGTITGGTWGGSDKRFKKNISSIDNALEIVGRLKGVTYEFRDDIFPEVDFSHAQSAGYIAQDLKEVFPNAVRQMDNGYYAVCYDAIIPLLSEAINEQNQLLNQFKTELDQLKEKETEGSSYHNGFDSGLAFKSSILQNRPNPFTDRTTIGYQLLDEFTQASIIITDLSGTQLLSFEDLRKGSGSVEVSYADLTPGIFLYSLILDGEIVDTKRMVLMQ